MHAARYAESARTHEKRSERRGGRVDGDARAAGPPCRSLALALEAQDEDQQRPGEVDVWA